MVGGVFPREDSHIEGVGVRERKASKESRWGKSGGTEEAGTGRFLL